MSRRLPGTRTRLAARAELEILGNIGQVGADVVIGDSEIGKMVRFGDKRSHFSGKIEPGDHVLKLESDDQVLWSMNITALAGTEYFLDSTHGGTVPPEVRQEDREPAELAEQQARLNPASPSSPADKLEGGGGQGELNEINWIYEPDQGLVLAAQQKKPVMMDFYTDWCGWCKKLDENVYSKRDIIDLSVRFISIKVNAEKYPETASRFRASGYPTIVFLNSDGTVNTRIAGYRNGGEFYSIMSKAAK